MSPSLRRLSVLVLLIAVLCGSAFASAYNARPKVVVVIVVDQLRGDLLERYHDELPEGGFRLLMDGGAWFSNCNYQYANTRTGPGHATIGSGAYTLGHGIIVNDWYDASKKRRVASVDDETTTVLGANISGSGASPRRMLTDTVGDELRMATQGRARVYGVSLKDRSAILPTGYAANGAFWIDHKTGDFITSSYYMKQAPDWLTAFNASGHVKRYLDREWKDAEGKTIRTTAPQANPDGRPMDVYNRLGNTPFANDYTIDFARELFLQEKLGTGPSTDLLIVSFSAPDVLGHNVGPDSPEHRAMLFALDRQLADFFSFMGKQIGLANVVVALTADHGIAPVAKQVELLHIPAEHIKPDALRAQLNATISARLNRPADYITSLEYPLFYLSEAAFTAAGMKEGEAERITGDAMMQAGMRGFYTKAQLAAGDVPATNDGHKYLNSYSPYGGWWVFGVQPPFFTGAKTVETDHASIYSYDTHVPLAFWGIPFKAGNYREATEPVDLAVTLSSLLGINAPAHSVGRVLNKAFADNPVTPKEGRR